MRRVVVMLALLGGAALAGEKKELSKKEIGAMMKDTHHGEKAPQARVTAELKKDAPDWDAVGKDVKAFVTMGEALKKMEPSYYASPEKYIASSAALAKASGEKDKKGATDALAALNKSCVACHAYGKPK